MSNSIVKLVDADYLNQRAGRAWSLANASVPVTLAVGWVAQLVFLGYWIGGLSTEVHTLTKNQDKADAQVYQQKDATRDLAIVQSHMDAISRRVELLEQERRK